MASGSSRFFCKQRNTFVYLLKRALVTCCSTGSMGLFTRGKPTLRDRIRGQIMFFNFFFLFAAFSRKCCLYCCFFSCYFCFLFPSPTSCIFFQKCCLSSWSTTVYVTTALSRTQKTSCQHSIFSLQRNIRRNKKCTIKQNPVFKSR